MIDEATEADTAEAPPYPFCEGRWDVSREGYYADRECVSHSALEVFRKSVREYHAIFVTGEVASPGGTEAMDFGNAVHIALLEPDKFQSLVMVAPKCDRRTTVGKERWEAFLSESQGRLVITDEQAAELERMVKAVNGDPLASSLLRGSGAVEQAVRWYCPDTGLKMRCKLDLLHNGTGDIIDIKTARDMQEEEFGRSAYNFGYHRQAALYLQASRMLSVIEGGPVINPRFFFVVVSKGVVPDCIVYEPDEEMLLDGYRENLDDLRRMRDCRDFDNWTPSHAGRVNKLSLPLWKRRGY